jgi:hypothetical protein
MPLGATIQLRIPPATVIEPHATLPIDGSNKPLQLPIEGFLHKDTNMQLPAQDTGPNTRSKAKGTAKDQSKSSNEVSFEAP